MRTMEIQMQQDTIDQIKKRGKVLATGSRVICNPPPLDTDEDWLLLLDGPAFDESVVLLLEMDFSTSELYLGQEDNRFRAFKKGSLNILLTKDSKFFAAFSAATFVAKKLNLLKKNDRIMLFQAVLYHNKCDPSASEWGF